MLRKLTIASFGRFKEEMGVEFEPISSVQRVPDEVKRALAMIPRLSASKAVQQKL
jgi:hypothetical protein